MNTCTVCFHPQSSSVDAELRESGANAARVARRYRMSAQAVRRHVRNRHVRPEPIPGAAASARWLPPGMKRPATEAEMDAALDAWLPAVASFSGISAEGLRSHYAAVPHDPGCPECAALEEHEPLLDAFVASAAR